MLSVHDTDVRAAGRRMAGMARAFAAACTDLTIDFSPEAIAEKTGMSLWEVRDIQSSPEFEAFVARACRAKAMGAFARSLERLEKFLEDGVDRNGKVLSPYFDLNVSKHFLATMEKLTAIDRRHDEMDADAKTEDLLRKLEMHGKLRKPKVEIT